MRCKAKARSTGDRCKRKAVEGLTVCRSHGAGSPQSKAKSARIKAEARAAAEVQAQADAVLAFRAERALEPLA